MEIREIDKIDKNDVNEIIENPKLILACGYRKKGSKFGCKNNVIIVLHNKYDTSEKFQFKSIIYKHGKKRENISYKTGDELYTFFKNHCISNNYKQKMTISDILKTSCIKNLRLMNKHSLTTSTEI